MKCDWIKRDNKIVGAKYKGKESQLFKLLENKFGLGKAIEMYEVSRSTEFLDIFGVEEPTLKQLANYIVNQNKSEEILSIDDRADLLDSGIIDPSIFYDEFGFFTISPKKLKTAGYSDYEIKNIENNKEAIKSAIERLNNTEDVEMSEVDNTDLEFLNEFNIFGKLRTFNPQKEIFDTLVGIKDQNEFNSALLELPYPNFQNRVNAEELFKEMSQYKKAEVYLEYEGEIRPAKINETAIVLPLKVKDNYQGQNLSQIRLDVLQENEATTREALKQIEKDLIGSGLDVIGLSEKAIDEDLINFLDSVDSFYSDLDSQKFAEVYDSYFSINTEPKTTAVKKDDQAVYVELNTALSEEEVYEKAGLIKAENNLWIKTAKEDLTQLYNNLRTYTEKYPKDITLEEYVQKQIAELDDFKNAENAEAVMLYKMYFNVQSEEAVNVVKQLENFTGNYDYLTTEYVADFNIEILKEKAKNSAKYKNFYSNFDINERGIYLKENSNLSKVELYADENLRNYSLLSKQMPDLTTETEFETSRYFDIENAQKYKGQLYRLNDNEIVLKNQSSQFIKVGEKKFENIENYGNLSHYIALEENKNPINIKTPKSDINLVDFSYLETTPEKFISAKQYLTKQEKENQEDYEC